MKLALISCSKLKLAQPAPARSLYTSPLFKKALEYAERRADEVLVLSAAHGLVELDRVIEPYEFTLQTRSPDERRWCEELKSAVCAWTGC